jgi:prepilin signal peptidase PulO-like enzyme (type II secretory pathway)
MSFLLAAVFFAFGTIVASFVGVLVARLNTGQSFLVGRSRCDACNTSLSPLVLVPVFSYIVAQGRARCCGARLAFQAPLVEMMLGGLFVFVYLKLGSTIALPSMLLSLTLLFALVQYDLMHHILPAALLGAFVLASAATGFFLSSSVDAWYVTVFVAFLIASSLALLHLFSRGRAMGFADAPLVLGLALLTGSAALAGFIFSFWIGAAVGIVVLLKRPVGSRMGVEVPFAPFLAAGFLLAYFTQWNPFIFVASLPGL